MQAGMIVTHALEVIRSLLALSIRGANSCTEAREIADTQEVYSLAKMLKAWLNPLDDNGMATSPLAALA